MTDILDYSEKISRHSIMLDGMAETYAALTDRLSSLERIVKSVSIDYLIKNPASKASLEKVETLAICDNMRHRAEYEELTALRIVVKSLDRRMDIVEHQMSAQQSVMKWNTDASYMRGK